jgi:hypothetical protein
MERDSLDGNPRFRNLGKIRRSALPVLLLGLLILVLCVLVVKLWHSSVASEVSNVLLFAGVFVVVLAVSIWGGVSIAMRQFSPEKGAYSQNASQSQSIDTPRTAAGHKWWRIAMRAQVLGGVLAIVVGGVLARYSSFEIDGQIIFAAGCLSFIIRIGLRNGLARWRRDK